MYLKLKTIYFLEILFIKEKKDFKVTVLWELIGKKKNYNSRIVRITGHQIYFAILYWFHHERSIKRLRASSEQSTPPNYVGWLLQFQKMFCRIFFLQKLMWYFTQGHREDFRSGHPQFKSWTIWAMDRTSAQPQVNLSLQRKKFLKFQPQLASLVNQVRSRCLYCRFGSPAL